jgi:hypothetical protein
MAEIKPYNTEYVNIKKTRLPLVSGILNIIGGFTGVICGHLTESLYRPDPYYYGPDTATATIIFYASVIALGGGFFSIKRQTWSLVMLGSVSTLLIFSFLALALSYYLAPYSSPAPHVNGIYLLVLPLGIACIVLTILSRHEFQ